MVTRTSTNETRQLVKSLSSVSCLLVRVKTSRHDFRLSPQCKQDLHCSGILLIVEW